MSGYPLIYWRRFYFPLGFTYLIQSQVASYQRLLKWYLIPPCLTLSNIRYVSRVKWSNSGKGVVSSSTPQCSSYWKGSLHVASTMVANFISIRYEYIHLPVKQGNYWRTTYSKEIICLVWKSQNGCISIRKIDEVMKLSNSVIEKLQWVEGMMDDDGRDHLGRRQKDQEMVGWFLWHINFSRLFNTKSCLYIYETYDL